MKNNWKQGITVEKTILQTETWSEEYGEGNRQEEEYNIWLYYKTFLFSIKTSTKL